MAASAAPRGAGNGPWYLVVRMAPPGAMPMYLGWVHYGQKQLHFPKYSADDSLSGALQGLQDLRVLPTDAAFSAQHIGVGRTRVAYVTLRRHFKEHRSKQTRAYMWCTASEFRGVPALRVHGGVWDCTVAPRSAAIAESMQFPVREVVLYHGTTHGAAQSILRGGFVMPQPYKTRLHLEVAASRADGGGGMYLSPWAQEALERPYGMLGRAVYFACFDKAQRFALKDAAGHDAPDAGTVLRCVFPMPRSVLFMKAGFLCSCCTMHGVDHGGEWRAHADACVFSDNGQLSTGVEVALASAAGVRVLQRRRLKPAPAPSPATAAPTLHGMEPLQLCSSFTHDARPSTPEWTAGDVEEACAGGITPPAAGGGGGGSSTPVYSGNGGASPAYAPTSPPLDAQGSASPAYAPTSPPFDAQGGASPAYVPTSPPLDAQGGASPAYAPTSPPLDAQGGASPAYAPTSPAYVPTSPPLDAQGGASPAYAPTSPAYVPTSPPLDAADDNGTLL